MLLFYIHELKECLFKLLFNEKFASQILHLNNLVFPSWTERICLFNELLKYVFTSFPFVNNFGYLSKLHVKGFLLSWTLPMCFFRLLFLEKNCGHKWFLSIVNWRAVITNSHLNVLYPSWTGSMCLFKLPFWEKMWSQMSHLSGFFPSWTSELCFLKFFLREIFWLHKDIQIFHPFMNTNTMSL